MAEQKTKIFLFLVLVLAFIGTIDALHLLEIKYGSEKVNCDLSERFSCTSVNHSPHSQVGDFPVAGIGLLGYVLLGLMSFTLINEKLFVKDNLMNNLVNKWFTPLTLVIVAVFGFIIQAYYTYVEFFVLDQFCIYCLFSQALILGIMTFALWNLKN